MRSLRSRECGETFEHLDSNKHWLASEIMEVKGIKNAHQRMPHHHHWAVIGTELEEGTE